MPLEPIRLAEESSGGMLKPHQFPRGKTLKRVLTGLVLILVGLVAVALGRALSLGSKQLAVEAVSLPEVDGDLLAAKLARAIQFQTVSHAEGEPRDPAAFTAFHAFLAEALPQVYAALDHGTVGTWSQGYAWPGSDPALSPLLLTAHFDVVPVDPGSETRWSHPPFAGAVAEGYVWGRGAMDDKAGAVSILQAVETLLARGFRPRRTVLLFLGHDEEAGGERGAAVFAARLAGEGVEP
jgi:carboxypeptidase PM20D1